MTARCGLIIREIKKRTKKRIVAGMIMSAAFVVLCAGLCFGAEQNKCTKQELFRSLMAKYPWEMTIVYEDGDPAEFELSNFIEDDIRALVKDVFNNTDRDSFKLEFSVSDEELYTDMTVLKKLYNKSPSSVTLVRYDAENDCYEYGAGQDGIEIDEEELAKRIREAVDNRDFSATIELPYKVTKPELDEAKAKELFATMGSFTTNSTANENRNTNLDLACKAIDGTVLKPGEEFSFNLTTGNRTAAKGYKAAGAYAAGQVVEEEGGGVCQVASTLYNAVIASGLRATERHAHTYEPSYVTPGNDAMVSYDGYSGPDFKFVNTSSASICIRASYWKQQVSCAIVGIPVLEPGEKHRLVSEKTEDFGLPGTVYVENPNQEPGTEIVLSKGSHGSVWTTKLVISKDGVDQSSEVLHKSKYKGHVARISRNTAVPVQEENVESEEADMSGGPGVYIPKSVREAEEEEEGGPGVIGTQTDTDGSATGTQAGTEDREAGNDENTGDDAEE